MRKFTIVMSICLLAAVMGISFTGTRAAAVVAERKIKVVIEYGNGHTPRTVAASVVPGQTVLGALQQVATVETHPVDQYVFVTAIDGIQGKRGEMAWYYTIDGAKADTLAAANVLTDQVEQITWSYQKDVCSCTVDKK